jgi:signal transduction histidine kinase
MTLRDQGGPAAIAPSASQASTPWQEAARIVTLRQTGAVLLRIVELGRTLGGGSAAVLLLHDGETGHFVPTVPRVAVGLDERWLRREGLEAAQALARQAAEAHDLVEVSEMDGAASALPFLESGLRPASACAVPLEGNEGVIGVVEVYGEGPPHALDAAALREFAALAAAAILNARDHERAQAARRQLEALDEASKTLAAELSLEHVLQTIVELAARIAGARYGALGVAGPDGYLTDFITTGLTAEEREKIGPLPRGHGLLGVLIHAGQPVRIPNLSRDPRRIGFPPHHPPMTSLLGVPLRVRQQVVGDLYLTDKIGAPEFSAEDQWLIEMLAAHAGIAIENARLYAELRDLTALRERERIGRELHDGIIQDLFASSLQLEDIADGLGDEQAQARLMGLAETLSAVIADVRAYIQGLRARRLEGRALDEALAALVREITEGPGPAATFVVEGRPYWLSDEQATALLQIAREALSNVTRHAQATRAEVHLSYSELGVGLRIDDDGRGFDPAASRGEEHRGLHNLRTRMDEAGGRLTVESDPQGGPRAGTTLTAFLPRSTSGAGG